MVGDTWDKGVDLVAVERAALCRGVCPELNPQERLRAVLVMSEAEKSTAEIAVRLGLSERTVTRWRGDLGVSA